MASPFISIILPIYNGEIFLSQAIQSILNQSYSKFELICVDDASTDNSLRILESINDKRIKIIRNRTNRGLSASLNIGIKHAKNCILARMDQDDISHRHRLRTQLKYLQQQHLDLVGTWYQDINEQNQLIRKIERIYLNSDLKRALLIDNYFCHGSIMFYKPLWTRVGGYRTKYDYAEDYDFISRACSIKGIKFGNVPKVLYSHRVNKQGMSLSNQAKQESTRKKISLTNLKHLSLFYSSTIVPSTNQSVKKTQAHISQKLLNIFIKHNHRYFLKETLNYLTLIQK